MLTRDVCSSVMSPAGSSLAPSKFSSELSRWIWKMRLRRCLNTRLERTLVHFLYSLKHRKYQWLVCVHRHPSLTMPSYQHAHRKGPSNYCNNTRNRLANSPHKIQVNRQVGTGKQHLTGNKHRTGCWDTTAHDRMDTDYNKHLPPQTLRHHDPVMQHQNKTCKGGWVQTPCLPLKHLQGHQKRS